ncbi:MAG: cobyrinic acid ac-diamide synthase [Actinomycetia bacterium]|nr:cobyrinic acid ac-diamide synthase [Actinomycetes bacterium]
MIVVVAALKGGVGKTTTSIYLAAAAATGRREVRLVDADPQASAAEWWEAGVDEQLAKVGLVEAPTDRLLGRALVGLTDEDIAIVDTPPGQERLLTKALEQADAVVLPTRIGGVETGRVDAVLEMVPKGVPVGVVVSSARTYTRDYQDAIAEWAEQDVRVWGTVPERVSIAAGPRNALSFDGMLAYKEIWRKVQRSVKP